MKAIIFALVATASITASAKYITVRVCEQNEYGQEWCHVVKYKDRGASKAQAAGPQMCPGEYGVDVPCPTKYGVPGWLKGLNGWFKDNGFEAPGSSSDYDPSGA